MPLSDEQKIVLHMCMEAGKAGHDLAWISRDDILAGEGMPAAAKGTAIPLRIMFAALSLPDGVLEWSPDGQRFRMSAEAIAHVREKARRHITAARPGSGTTR
jgi:hypothetical protein